MNPGKGDKIMMKTTISEKAATVQPLPAKMENEPQHTPGKWYVQPIGSKIYVESDGPVMICDMQADECLNPLEVAVMRANARLIAAAPELLKALEAACRLDYFNEHNSLAYQARAAIAAAKGGQP